MNNPGNRDVLPASLTAELALTSQWFWKSV